MSATTPQSSSSSSPSAGGAPARDIFQDPALARAADDDPIARYIIAHWKRLLVTIAAAGALYFGYSNYTLTREAKRGADTALFSQVHEQYGELVAKQDALATMVEDLAGKSEQDRKELETKIKEATDDVQARRSKLQLKIDSLATSHPFDMLRNLYTGLVAARFREFDRVKSVLVANPWALVGKAGSAERRIGEFSTLALAKALSESEPHLAAAKESLKDLAEKGEFAAVPAAVALRSLPGNESEKQGLRDLIEKLKTRFPTQQKFLAEANEAT